jgi:hypothetical protein
MCGDVSPTSWWISVSDEGMDEPGPAEGERVVVPTGPDGHETEFYG